MKKLFYVLLLLPVLLTGCLKDICNEKVTYKEYMPEFKTLASMKELNPEGPRPIENKGKIYVYGKYLLINDYHKGIHIFNNEDPAHPVALAFYPIEGNVDMSVKDNILYADNFLHLLSIDISDPVHPKLIHINEDVFIAKYYQEYGFIDTAKNLIAVSYKPTNRTEVHDCNEGFGLKSYWENGNVFFTDDVITQLNSSSDHAQTIGIGGSTARFTIIDDALYSVLPGELNTFDISDVSRPVYRDKVTLQWNAETIFPFHDKLLIGTSQGLMIYDITDPLLPRLEGEFSHVSSCDPVVAKGNIAYVTLWSGSACNNNSQANQLDILNISDMKAPVLLASVPMKTPRGLGLYNNELFICQGDNGVSLYDVTNAASAQSKLLATFNNIKANDVIILSDALVIFTGDDGIRQYHWDKNNGLSYLSEIK